MIANIAAESTEDERVKAFKRAASKKASAMLYTAMSAMFLASLIVSIAGAVSTPIVTGWNHFFLMVNVAGFVGGSVLTVAAGIEAISLTVQR